MNAKKQPRPPGRLLPIVSEPESLPRSSLVPLYSSIIDFFECNNITVGRNEEWRLTERLHGEIQGLPGSRGFLTATNGILCYVEQHSRLFLGHLHWFVTDKNERIHFNRETKTIEVKTTRTSKMTEMVKDLL